MAQILQRDGIIISVDSECRLASGHAEFSLRIKRQEYIRTAEVLATLLGRSITALCV